MIIFALIMGVLYIASEVLVHYIAKKEEEKMYRWKKK